MEKFRISRTSPGSVFLDVGCSEGFYVEAAQLLGMAAYGVDVPSKKITELKSTGLKVYTTDEPLPVLSADFVLLRHTIEHLPFFLKSLNQAVHLLQVGGVLFVETPNQGGLFTLWKRRHLKADRFLGHLYPPSHVNGFEKRTFRFMQEKLGLQLDRVLTYSQASPAWVPGKYSEGSLKRIAHHLSATIGMGENIAAIYRKQK